MHQRGPEELLPSLPPMAQSAWPDPSLPELPAPWQGDFFPLSSDSQTHLDGSLPNATRATQLRSSVRVSMTRGHVTRWHRRCHPARACTESSLTTAKPLGSFPFPLLAPAWLRVTFHKAPSQGTAGTPEWQWKCATGLRWALVPICGLSAAARSLIDPKETGEGNSPQGLWVQRRQEKVELRPLNLSSPPLCFPHPCPPNRKGNPGFSAAFDSLLLCTQQGGEGLVSISWLQTAPGLSRQDPPAQGSLTHGPTGLEQLLHPAPLPQLFSPEVPPSCSAQLWHHKPHCPSFLAWLQFLTRAQFPAWEGEVLGRAL